MTKCKGLSALQIQRDRDPTRIWYHYSDFYQLSVCFHLLPLSPILHMRSNKRSNLTAGLFVRPGDEEQDVAETEDTAAAEEETQAEGS